MFALVWLLWIGQAVPLASLLDGQANCTCLDIAGTHSVAYGKPTFLSGTNDYSTVVVARGNDAPSDLDTREGLLFSSLDEEERTFVRICGSGVTSPGPDRRRLPRFLDYPVRRIFAGKNATLERLWRKAPFPSAKTNVREAIRKRPDFAGHYIVAIGDCGASCLQIHVIDARTGRVYPFPHVIVVSWLHSAKGNPPPAIEYHPHSCLIILRGIRDERPGDFGTHYYVFRRGRFRHLLSVHAIYGRRGFRDAGGPDPPDAALIASKEGRLSAAACRGRLPAAEAQVGRTTLHVERYGIGIRTGFRLTGRLTADLAMKSRKLRLRLAPV